MTGNGGSRSHFPSSCEIRNLYKLDTSLQTLTDITERLEVPPSTSRPRFGHMLAAH